MEYLNKPSLPEKRKPDRILLPVLIPAVILLAATLGNCRKDNQGPLLEAITGPDTTGSIGDTVWLSAAASRGNDYTVEWSFHSRPASDSITWSDSATAFFIPSQNGSYQVKLEIRSNDIFDADFQNILVAGALRIEDIGERTRLKKISVNEEADYIATTPVNVTADLIVDIGVVIEFKENASLIIRDEGTIYAENASFVAADSTWQGIAVETTGNAFAGCLIENAGNESFTADPGQKAAVLLKSGATLAFSNNTIKQSAGYGIIVIDGGSFFEDTENLVYPYRNNKFIANANGPMVIPVNVLSDLAGQFLNEETEGSYIEIYESAYSSGQAKNPWFSNQGLPYRITGFLTFNKDLTINNGAELYFDPGAGMRINGKLTVSGTEAAPVIMDGTTEGTGAWKGIYIPGGQVDITYLNLLDAGGSLFSGLSEKAAVTVEQVLSMKNSTISGSGGIGLKMQGNAHIQYAENFSSNSFENNAAAAIQLRFDDVGKAVSTSSISSASGTPAVEVFMGLDDPPGTWKNLDADYDYSILEPVTIKATKELVIEAGTQIRMHLGTTLTVNGGLTARGTSGSEISILGHEGSKGFWDGIFLNGTQTVTLDHMIISHGGGGFQDKGNLIIGTGASDVSVTNSTINNSKGYGVLIKSGSQDFAINDPASANTLEGDLGGFHAEAK